MGDLGSRRHIPREWFPDLGGMNVLCLASGGGQQGPILAAAGAKVTVFDNSPKQLERDGQVAQRESLSIRLELGDMQDLSRFQDGEFELIVANGLGCVENIRSVWKHCYRVLSNGGIMISGGQNPIEFVFDLREWNKGRLVARHRIPYSDARDLDEKERSELLVDGDQPMFFGHSLEDQLQGQLSAGFMITGFFEDNSGEANPLDRFINMYYGIRSIKP